MIRRYARLRRYSLKPRRGRIEAPEYLTKARAVIRKATEETSFAVNDQTKGVSL
jgi:hypothetical protein